MRTTACGDVRRGISWKISLTLALVGLSRVLAGADDAQASDLQRSTDHAAIEAKQSLCVALNRGAATPELRQDFFNFYEGKIVSARRLHPDTMSIGQIGPLAAFKVLQVLGPNALLASIDSRAFKLKGVSTADVADDQTIRLTDFFLVGNTETYDTVGGSTNTVYVLEPADGKMPKVFPTRVYPWYNRKDEVVVTGEFKAIDGPNAVFVVGGHEKKVQLTNFTRGDRDLMRILVDRYPQAPLDTPPPGDTPVASPTKPAAQPVGID
jgi:hypothetical protein